MSAHNTQSVSSPLSSPSSQPGVTASPNSGTPAAPVDVAAVLALNAQMQAAGAELQKKVQALEAEKAALLAQQSRDAATSSASGSHSHPKGPTPPEFYGTKTGGYEIDVHVHGHKCVSKTRAC